MRGADEPQTTLRTDHSVEARIPAEHPLRMIHGFVNPILTALSPRFEALYSRIGRPSIPPQRPLRRPPAGAVHCLERALTEGAAQ